MTWTVHRAERTDVLAAELGRLLSAPLADPFQAEVVAVPAKGVERWLSQQLAAVLGAGDLGGDGVASGIVFPSPARLVDQALAAGGAEAEDDPWAPQRLLWAVLDTVDDCLGEPWCGVLSAHLGSRADAGPDEHRAGRRYATAEHLRTLLRSYAAHRPAMLVDWVAGGAGDGAGGRLDPDQRWQAQLWRRVHARIGSPSPAERLPGTCAALRDDPALSALPERLSLFGATRLTSDQRQVLAALAAHRDVHLWLPHPSPAMWEQLRTAPAVLRRTDDQTALSVRHPLLASLSRDTRELQQLLPPGVDVHHAAPVTDADTLLAHLQAAVRDDVPPEPRAGADGTVSVHACHGPARQVEVLREVLLHLFRADPSLEPRDVLVLCPDVETYAPHVRALFGHPHGNHPGHRLRVRLADRALRATNPLLDVLARLLELAGGRVSASAVLDLAASAPLRRRFDLREDDLERLRAWTAETGVRWGLGERERAAYRLEAVPEGTWSAGLDRLLLGVAADESALSWLGAALPLDDVDSSDIALAGRLAELLERLDAALSSLQGPAPLEVWTAALTSALEALTAVLPADAWQTAEARRELAGAAEHGSEAVLRLADVRALLAGRLAGRPTRAGFRTGELTVCTMVPMRSVPHRVVALLGLDEGVFPRASSVDGDDVLQRAPCLGERDLRSEDRQLLLDALLSARDHLVLLYTGADPVSGAVRPPAVPLSEVLEVLRDTTGDAELTGVLHRHPLQAFDADCFTGTAELFLPTGTEPFSFDRTALAGARAAAGPRHPPAPLLPAPLPALTDDVELAELVALLVHPTRAFLTRRLGVTVPDRDEAVRDALPVELDALAGYDAGDRLLRALLEGTEPAVFFAAESRRGTLPPGELGQRARKALWEAVLPIADACRAMHAGPARTAPLAVPIGARRLTGTVAGLHDDVLASSSYARLGAKHRLAAWVRLVALTAAGVPARAVTTGRGPYRQPVRRSTLQPPEDAPQVLADLVALYDEGMRAPLPMVVDASCEYAERRARGDEPEAALQAARSVLARAFEDRYVSYLYGHPRNVAALTADVGDGEEPTRFGTLARRVWDPLLAAEQLGRP